MRPCPKCGTQVSDSAAVCPQCGHAFGVSTESEQSQKQASDVVSMSAPSSPEAAGAAAGGTSLGKKSSKVALLTVILLVLLGGAAAASYMFLSKSPKDRFMEAQLQSLTTLATEIGSGSDVQTELQRRLVEEPSATTMEISGGLRNPGALGEDAQMLDDLLRRANVTLVTKYDPENQVTSNKAKLKMEGSELIAGEFWESEERLALHVPTLYPKHVVLENRNLGQFFRNLGMDYSGPDRFTTRNEAREVTTKHENDIMAFMADYGKYIVDFVQEEEVTLEKGVAFESPEGSVKLDQLTLTLSEERMRELLNGMATKLGDDDKGLTILSEVIAASVKTSGQSTFTPDSVDAREMQKWQDPAYVKNKLKQGASDFPEDAKDIAMPGGLKITILVDGKEIANQKVDFTLEDLKFSLETTRWKNKDKSVNHAVRMAVEQVGSGGGNRLALDVKSKTTESAKNEKKITTEGLVEFYDRGRKELEIKGNLDILVEKEVSGGKTRTTYDFKVNLDGTDVEDLPQVKGKAVVLADSKIANDRHGKETSLEFTLISPRPTDPSVGGNMKIKTTVELNQPSVSVPVTTSADSVRLNDLSPEEMNALIQEVSMNGMQFLQRNAHLFQ